MSGLNQVAAPERSSMPVAVAGVAGADVYRSHYDFIRSYCRMSDDEAIAATLWSMATWVVDAFDCVPYLGITSPESEAGKTVLLDTLAQLVARPHPCDYDTPLSIADAISTEHVTILYDEADATLRGREKMRGIFNAGYKRNKPYRSWINGKRVAYDVFGPKAFGGIGALPQTIASRCILINMQRLLPHEFVEKFDSRTAAVTAAPIRNATQTWATHFLALEHPDPKVLRRFQGRAAEIVGPMLAVAESCGESIAEYAADALFRLRCTQRDDINKTDGVKVLESVQELFQEHNRYGAQMNMLQGNTPIKRLPSSTIAGRLGMTEKMVANLLAPYGIHPGAYKTDGQFFRGYKHDDFVAAWQRYLRPQPEEDES